LESKSAALVAAVFVDFPKNKCNFLHKKLDVVRRVQFFTGRRPYEPLFSWAVATIALWKSAPMNKDDIATSRTSLIGNHKAYR